MSAKAPYSNIYQYGSLQQSVGFLAKPPPGQPNGTTPANRESPNSNKGSTRIVQGSITRAAPNRSLVIDESLHPQLFLDDTFLVVHGHSNASVSIQAGVAALWIPVLGRTLVSTNNSNFIAGKGDVYASDSQRDMTAEIGQKASCIAILARQKVWAEVLNRSQSVSTLPFAVMPAVHNASQCIRRRLFRFARETFVRCGERAQNLSLLASSLGELQSQFDPLIQRCPGPSLAAKRAVFIRLQRALNCILFSDKAYPKVSELAHLSNYSVHQFIRVFSQVYGRTPCAHISAILAERAKTLLIRSDLAITDVAAALGIQSPSTFKRIVKKNLGQSATSIRLHARAL